MPERKIYLTPLMEAGTEVRLIAKFYFVSLSNSMSRLVSHLGSFGLYSQCIANIQ